MLLSPLPAPLIVPLFVLLATPLLSFTGVVFARVLSVVRVLEPRSGGVPPPGMSPPAAGRAAAGSGVCVIISLPSLSALFQRSLFGSLDAFAASATVAPGLELSAS